MIDNYNRDGYHIAGKLLTAAECEALKAEALRVLKEKAKPGATVYVGLAAASPLFHSLASDKRLVAILEQIMPGGVMFMSDKLVLKSAAQRYATPWHVDSFYWQNTRPKISVWIALDRVLAENGALKVVRGSHKKEWRAKNADVSKTNGEFSAVIDSAQWKPEDEVICEVEKGSAIIFSDRLVHGSCENTAGVERFALISTYHAPAPDEEFDKEFPARHVVSKDSLHRRDAEDAKN